MPNKSPFFIDISIKLDGQNISRDLSHDFQEISIENSLHLPDVATLVIHDPQLRWIDDANLLPGKDLQVWIGPTQQLKKIFDGEIVEIEPGFDARTQFLTVRAFDRLHRLARGRKIRSFVNVNDSDLVHTIASEAGLSAKIEANGPVPATSQVYDYVFQNDETNLDFLRGRAEKVGYLLYVQNSTLYFKQPPVQGQAEGQPIALEWGNQLQEFRPRLTTIGQVKDIIVRGWNPDTKQAIIGKPQQQQKAFQVGSGGASGGSFTETAFQLQAPTFQVSRPVRDQTLAANMAQAIADQQAGHFVEAEGTCSGDPELVAGKSVTITKVGKRFSGTYFVTNTIHRYNEQGYGTQFSISGHRPSNLFNLFKQEASTAVPTGLVVGIVTDNNDPDGHGRVKVKYPWLSDEHTSDWARVVSLGAGGERGILFLPEVNDEVLVGFEMGDIHYPYILGGLWNKKDVLPPQTVTGSGKVQQRIIYSRTGHMIILDDNDNGGGITLQDKNGNKIVLDSQANKLTITVQGDATIEAKGNVSLSSDGNMTLDAKGNLSLQAKGQVQIKGNGAMLDGGPAIVNIKGSLINLN